MSSDPERSEMPKNWHFIKCPYQKAMRRLKEFKQRSNRIVFAF